MVLIGGVVIMMYDHRCYDAAWLVPVLVSGRWRRMMFFSTMTAPLSLGGSHYQPVGSGAYFFAVVTAIPLFFHFFGVFGGVVAVVAGDWPMYLIPVFGGSGEGVWPWGEVWAARGFFLALLGLGWVRGKSTVG